MSAKPKVSDQDVVEIRSMWEERQARIDAILAEYPTRREIADRLGVSLPTVDKILQGNRRVSRVN